MKNLLERIKKYFAKIKELKQDDLMVKNQNQCRFPGCDDLGKLIYLCRYLEPCFCEYHSQENSPWTRAYLEKCEWRQKTIIRLKRSV